MLDADLMGLVLNRHVSCIMYYNELIRDLGALRVTSMATASARPNDSKRRYRYGVYAVMDAPVLTVLQRRFRPFTCISALPARVRLC